MDQSRSWLREFSLTLSPATANLIIQTDGGRRSTTEAASALIVGLWGKSGEKLIYEPWIAQGIYMQTNVTVFQTEAIALEAALDITRMKLLELARHNNEI